MSLRCFSIDDTRFRMDRQVATSPRSDSVGLSFDVDDTIRVHRCYSRDGTNSLVELAFEPSFVVTPSVFHDENLHSINTHIDET